MSTRSRRDGRHIAYVIKAVWTQRNTLLNKNDGDMKQPYQIEPKNDRCLAKVNPVFGQPSKNESEKESPLFFQDILGNFNKEGEGGKDKAKPGEAVPPWVGHPNQESLKEECLALSKVSMVYRMSQF